MNVLVFDIGGTMVKYALMDEDANIHAEGEFSTNTKDFDAFMDDIVSTYHQYEKEVSGLAFSLPGRIDSDVGFIYSPGALSFNLNRDFISDVYKRIPLPITIENDGKCAALAEMWIGNLQGVKNGVAMVLGTGIGGGIVMNGELYKGSDFFAGEFSFMMLNYKQCTFENALAYQGSVRALVCNVAKKKGVEPNTLDGKKVFDMIYKHDVDAIACFDEMIELLSGAIFSLGVIVNPEKVLIGGGISKQKIVVESLQAKLDEIYDGLPFDIPRVSVGVCKYFNRSNLIGALYHYKTKYNVKGDCK